MGNKYNTGAMVMKTKKLLDALNEIIIELRSSGKKNAVDYFTLRYNNIKKSNNPLESIKELSTCRAMAQYAGFSITEENNLDKIVAYAVELLKDHKI